MDAGVLACFEVAASPRRGLSRPPFRPLILCLAFVPAFAAGPQDAPPQLTFNDLVKLAAEDPLPAQLQSKLDRVLNHPVIRNEAGPATSSASFRIAEWNINKGYHEPEIIQAFAAPGQFVERFASGRGQRSLREDERQLSGAGVIVLDEVDDGDKRTGYHDVARDLSRALDMNYVYAVEFIELNRIYLGVRKMDLSAPPPRADDDEIFGFNPNRYLGLEGTAVLSRYPILSARVVHLPAEYDWYHSEIKAISDLEKARRWTAEQLFDERVKRQIRRGNRIAVIVDLSVPESPTGVVTVIAPHLEDYTKPAGRRAQMRFLLTQIEDIRNPVIMAGDLNSLDHDGTPLTVRREIRDYLGNPRFWLREALFLSIPVPGLRYMLYPVNWFKNFRDPTAFSIPLLLPNHARGLFRDIRQFRFNDGAAFDFAGDPALSHGHKGSTLSQSSQRQWKGFVPTFSFKRTWNGLVGEFKIDWFFAKNLTPAGGRALPRVNTAPRERISDHCPTTLDLRLASARARAE